jgi:hypothetical protein
VVKNILEYVLETHRHRKLFLRTNSLFDDAFIEALEEQGEGIAALEHEQELPSLETALNSVVCL